MALSSKQQGDNVHSNATGNQLDNFVLPDDRFSAMLNVDSNTEASIPVTAQKIQHNMAPNVGVVKDNMYPRYPPYHPPSGQVLQLDAKYLMLVYSLQCNVIHFPAPPLPRVTQQGHDVWRRARSHKASLYLHPATRNWVSNKTPIASDKVDLIFCSDYKRAQYKDVFKHSGQQPEERSARS